MTRLHDSDCYNDILHYHDIAECRKLLEMSIAINLESEEQGTIIHTVNQIQIEWNSLVRF